MASYFPHELSLVDRGGRSVIPVPKGVRKCILWGPYQALEPGASDVVFEVAPVAYSHEDEPCCRIDVATHLGRTLVAFKDLTVRDLLQQQGKATLTFVAKEGDEYEFRVFAAGAAAFEAAFYRMARPAASQGQLLDLQGNSLYRENYDAIVYPLKLSGVEFMTEHGDLIAKIGGVVLPVKHREDLYLISEIFVANEYNFIAPRACIAIDIGMNVGFASLALARRPEVEAVFAYEPFSAPFQRARQNFELNPRLAAKIRPFNIGLADREEELDVRVNPGGTVATSIDGWHTGASERIWIRDAATEIGPCIESAVEKGLGVIVKMDCEGSEFAIFESLAVSSLLPKIDAFAIEWHKGPSNETQAKLIAPLTEAGFFVIDRSRPVDQYGGLLHAVRSGRSRDGSGRFDLSRSQLGKIVEKEAMSWGDAAAKGYHDLADAAMDVQWDLILAPLVKKHNVVLRFPLDFACGRGRNASKFLRCGAEKVFAVDVNPENIAYCKQRFSGKPVVSIVNNGYDLANIADSQFTLVYSWDAMVHFDLRIVASYLPEFWRVLQPGGLALIHHSNFSGRPGANFLTNPGARNFMSADIFRHLAIGSGFSCVEQCQLTWADVPDLDCISILRKPGETPF